LQLAVKLIHIHNIARRQVALVIDTVLSTVGGKSSKITKKDIWEAELLVAAMVDDQIVSVLADDKDFLHEPRWHDNMDPTILQTDGEVQFRISSRVLNSTRAETGCFCSHFLRQDSPDAT
jgi:hypothetical protein